MPRTAALCLTILALLTQHYSLRAAETEPKIHILGLPVRTTSGQELTVALCLEGMPGREAKVEMVTVLADRVVGRTMWQVPVQDGRGEKDVPVTLPETRGRVPLAVIAKVLVHGAVVNTTAESMILPTWNPDRLAGLLRDRERGAG
jgi:hypothetical protein